MRKHIVTCVKCGRQFDTNEEKGRYYPDSCRYECGRCVAEQKRAQKEQRKEKVSDERERKTGMRQSKPAMIAKIAAGVLFFLCSFSFLAQGELAPFACGLGVAAALIAWGLVPYLKAKKQKGE